MKCSRMAHVRSMTSPPTAGSPMPRPHGVLPGRISPGRPTLRFLAVGAVVFALCGTSRAQLVGHWKLDNDVTDSVGSHNGTVSGTETHAFGQVGKAMVLNGSTQVTLGSGVVPTAAYTKSAWVWCAASGTNSILSGDNSTSRHVFWVPAGNGGMLAAGHNGNYTLVQDSVPLLLSNWVHVAVSYDSSVNGGTLKLYKNGVLVGGSQAIASNVTAASAGAANIGGLNGNGYLGGRNRRCRCLEYRAFGRANPGDL